MERREEQPGAAGAGAAPAVDFTVENVEKVWGRWGGRSVNGAEVLGLHAAARAQAWAGACWFGAPGAPGICSSLASKQDSSVAMASWAIFGFS